VCVVEFRELFARWPGISVERWPLTARRAAALVIVLLVGGIDYVSGHEILLSSFYLVAVALAAWSVGAGFAVFVSMLSVAAWLVGDFAAGATYTRPMVPVWNALIILAFYLSVVVLLARLHTAQRQLEARVRARTIALTEEIAERERLEREILEIGEAERRRMGRDLHDSLGQLLTGVALAGQALHDRLESATRPEADEVARLVGIVEESVELTRSLARGLDPVEIEGGGLAQGLRELAARTQSLSGMRCEYVTPAPVHVEDSVAATHLYRIAQEAVTNAVRHGHPERIRICLERTPGGVRLSVEDDGCGLPPPGVRRAGMGLRIMAHRATVLHGTFDVRALPAGGTLVTCEAPA